MLQTHREFAQIFSCRGGHIRPYRGVELESRRYDVGDPRAEDSQVLLDQQAVPHGGQGWPLSRIRIRTGEGWSIRYHTDSRTLHHSGTFKTVSPKIQVFGYCTYVM